MTNKAAEHKMPFRTESGLYDNRAGEQSWARRISRSSLRWLFTRSLLRSDSRQVALLNFAPRTNCPVLAPIKKREK